MIAAGRTLDMAELMDSIDGQPHSTPVYVAAEGELYPVERAEIDGAGILLYADDALNLSERVEELEAVLRDIAASNETGARMTKAEIVKAAKAVL